MIEITQAQPLNSYNVAQLQYALADPKSNPTDFPYDLTSVSEPTSIIPSEADIEYDSRRMSSSATSAADTESSIMSRGEKRALTPADSPSSKRLRPAVTVDQNLPWDADSQSAPPTSNDEKLSADQDSKVSLPSIFTSFEDSYRPEARRASMPALHSESSYRSARHQPYPPTSLRNSYSTTNQSNLSSYQFPPPQDSLLDPTDKIPSRPRVSTDPNFNLNPQFVDQTFSNGTTPSSSSYTSNYTTPPSSAADYRVPPYAEGDSWNPSPGIVRPSSTPSELSSSTIKYDDNLRHGSVSGPVSQHLYAGSGRISGQQERRAFSNAGLKSEWSFPNSEYTLPSSNPSFTSSPPTVPSNAAPGSNSPSRSPQSVPAATAAPPLDRPPQRKRGKLPKETTDFLKKWLHHHSDHPYPSEEEKKQLCQATSLSMSQVSNWMINARRRILAPAHRASGPTTTAPFPPGGRSLSSAGMLDARRASMPTDSLQLYHPLSLQSLPAHHGGEYLGSTRHMLGMPPSRSHHLSGPGAMDYGSHHQGRLSLPYVPAQGSHSSGPSSHYLSSSHLNPSGHLYGGNGHHNSNGLAPIQQGQAPPNSYPSSFSAGHRASIHGHETSSSQAGNSFFTNDGQSSGYPAQ